MHGYSRLGRSTPSPPSSPRFRHGRTKNLGGFRAGSGELQNFVERLVYVLISAVYRRRGVLLVAPLLYISGMLLYMGSLGFDVVIIGKVSGGGGGKAAPVGSVYRSPQVFERLWPFMLAENNGSSSSAVSRLSFLCFLFYCFFGFLLLLNVCMRACACACVCLFVCVKRVVRELFGCIS